MALVELKNEETTTAGDHVYKFNDPELVGKLDALAKVGEEEKPANTQKWRRQWKRRTAAGAGGFSTRGVENRSF